MAGLCHSGNQIQDFCMLAILLNKSHLNLASTVSYLPSLHHLLEGWLYNSSLATFDLVWFFQFYL